MNNLRAFLPSCFRGLGLPLKQGQVEGVAANLRPRILIDVSVIIKHDAQTGIQRVVRAVWKNLLEQSGFTFEVVPVYASRTHGYRYARPDFLDLPVSKRLGGKRVRPAPGDKFLGLDLSAHLLPTHQRQLKSWRSAGVTIHLVIYDLLPLQRPDWFTDKAVRRFNRWLEVVRLHCDQALCISDQVARDLRAYLSMDAAHPAIGRLHLAGDLDGSCPSRGIDESTARAIEHALRNPAILMVGTVEPRKGYDVALAAFEHLWRQLGDQAPTLIIAGKPGWRTEALQDQLRAHLESGRRLFWLSTVSDEGLGKLYEASRGVLLTSHGEGFGLPAIEAAMHGRHVLVRDLPVFREQCLPNAIYFSNDSAESVADRIMVLIGKSRRPFDAPSLPTWDDCVAKLLNQLGFIEIYSSQTLIRNSDIGLDNNNQYKSELMLSSYKN